MENLAENRNRNAQADELERRSKLMQSIIISVGVPVFSGWGPRIVDSSGLIRSLN